MLHTIEHVFATVVECCILGFEIVGVLLLVYSAVKALVELAMHRDMAKVDLVEGIELALEFMLCGEVLHTIVARDLEALSMVAVVMALRMAITFLLHWELKNEKAHHAQAHDEEKK